MPTYTRECMRCGNVWSEWQSIHDNTKPRCMCGGTTRNVIERVNTYAVGTTTRYHDTREKAWDRDGEAYKRLRRGGFQPPKIDGCDRIEAEARDHWYIETGGKFSVPENRTQEINEMLALGKTNPEGWSPVEQVHANRQKGTA